MTKYALIIGCNYIGSPYQLSGCIQDALNLRNYLLSSRDYKAEHITLLTDDTPEKPTAYNIIYHFGRLMLQTHSDADEIWIHFSGHGSQIRATDKCEYDNLDETIIPLNYQTGGISDNHIHAQLRLAAKDAKIYMTFDCCHSATIADLQYTYRFALPDVVGPYALDADIKCISGCLDEGTSADAYINGRSQGAMSVAFVENIRHTRHALALLDLMNRYLKSRGFTQIPVISSSRPLNKDSLF